MPDREPRLGIDIGRVIIAGPGAGDRSDTAFFDGDETSMLATPEMTGSFAAIAQLVPLFGQRVWLVSKCGPRVQGRTVRWLVAHDFYTRTGIPEAAGHLWFCRRRADKREICLDLGITHFVDDRPDVLSVMSGAVPHRYLFGPQTRPAPAGTITVPDWETAEWAIRGTLVTAGRQS